MGALVAFLFKLWPISIPRLIAAVASCQRLLAVVILADCAFTINSRGVIYPGHLRCVCARAYV